MNPACDGSEPTGSAVSPRDQLLPWPRVPLADELDYPGEPGGGGARLDEPTLARGLCNRAPHDPVTDLHLAAVNCLCP